MASKAILVIANLQDDSHFTLSRMKPLNEALLKLELNPIFTCIYDLKNEARHTTIIAASEKLAKLLVDVDYCIVHKECLEFLPTDFFNRFTNVNTLGFLGDEGWQLNFVSNFLPMFSSVVVYESKGFLAYSKHKKQIYHLPLGNNFGYDVKRLYHKEADVVFIGRPYGVRAKMINDLYLHNIAIRVYGSEKWRGLIPDNVYQGFVSNEDYDATLSRSKIVLGFMETEDNTSKHINTKIFDTARVGTFGIFTHYEPLFRDYNLEEGKSVVTYRSTEQLLTKIKYYLDNEDEREKVALATQKALMRTANYKISYQKLISKFIKNDVQDTEKQMIKLALWKQLSTDAALANIETIDQICELNSDAKIIVLNTEGKCRTIVKRLPIVDSGSVLYRTDSPRPFEFCGVAWVPTARRLPHFPLNHYSSRARPLAFLILGLETFICFLLEMYRERIAKTKPV